MVRCSALPGGPKELHQLVPEIRFELSSSVSDYGGGNSKSSDPSMHESLSHRVCRDVNQRKSFWPPCEAINTGEEVGVTS